MKNGLSNSIKESGENISGFMDEVTKQIVELNKRVCILEGRMNLIQKDLGELINMQMAKVSNKKLNESILKLTDMMKDE